LGENISTPGFFAFVKPFVPFVVKPKSFNHKGTQSTTRRDIKEKIQKLSRHRQPLTDYQNAAFTILAILSDLPRV
jgi:hypothetical protein